jgi:GWxTD domain-containing protein
VSPGRYHARISVRDLNAESSSVASERLDVPDYSNVPVGFADLELGTVDSTGRFAPVPTRVFGRDVSRLAARVALFDRRPGAWPRTYPFRYRILDEQGLEIQSGDRALAVALSAEPAVVRPSNGDLFLGSYVFEVDLTDGRSHWRVARSFEVAESGPPSGKEFTRMLEVLSYIAEAKEVERLRSLKPAEQAWGWEEFWRKRDPTAGTGRNEAQIEFFRRVRYAERHFQGFGPGWRSDMGRIYIKYGPPDQVESRPATLQSPPVEIWYYSHPVRQFVFADREGFGRFVLVSPGSE